MVEANEGLVLAGLDTFFNRYDRVVGDSYTNRKTNKFINDLTDGLVCYGVEVIKPSLKKKAAKLHADATEKIMKIRNDFPDNKMLFIDSGGFQIIGGRVPINYISYLTDIYTDFIRDTNLTDMRYFYLDIPPVMGITESDGLAYMRNFQKMLMDKTKDNEQHKKMYLIHHCNTPYTYQMFKKYIHGDKVYEQLGSHRWAVGGMVILNFNDSDFTYRPYILPLFEIIDLEREYLDNGGEVFFHILGTSSIYDMILFAWMITLIKLKGWKLIITFDSTTPIAMSTKSGKAFYIEENRVFHIETRQNKLHVKPAGSNRTNEEFMHKIVEDTKSMIPVTIGSFENTSDWYTADGRWNNEFNILMVAYQFHVFSNVWKFILNYCLERKDVLFASHSSLSSYGFELLKKTNFNGYTVSGLPANGTTFLKRIMNILFRSIDAFKQMLDGTIDPATGEKVIMSDMAKFKQLNTKTPKIE